MTVCLNPATPDCPGGCWFCAGFCPDHPTIPRETCACDELHDLDDVIAELGIEEDL